jgi:hypothetical protein
LQNAGDEIYVDDLTCTPIRPSPEERHDGDGIDYSGSFVTDEVFDTYKDGCNWCKEVAVGLRFEVVISGHKPQRDGRDVVHVKCNRATFRSTLGSSGSSSRSNTHTKSTGCKFMVNVVQRLYDLRYVVVTSSTTGFHNHPLIVYGEGNRQLGKLTPEMKEKIRELAAAQFKSSKILFALYNQFPGCMANLRQVYNERHKQKKESSEGRNPMEQFAHLASELDYLFFIEAEAETGVVRHVFAAHPDSVTLFRAYPHVVLMDCTYKTNRYRFPMCEMVGVTPTNMNFLIGFALISNETEDSYRWVLQCLRYMIGNSVDPYVIITDRELGIPKPLAEVFPKSIHLLCSWHIKKDVLNRSFYHLSHSRSAALAFTHNTWEAVMTASSTTEFDEAIKAMYEEYGHVEGLMEYVERTWLVHKQKFVLRWTNNVRHFGNITTNRVESQHSVMKHWLESGRCSMDTLFERAKACVVVQVHSIKKELDASRSKTNTNLHIHNVFPYQYLIRRASLRCIQLMRMEDARIVDLGNDPRVTCGCVLRSTCGAPCACQIWQCRMAGVPISCDAVDIFWRTLVVPGLQSLENDGDDQAGPSQPGDDADLVEFNELVGHVSAADRAKMRRVSALIRRELFPETAGLKEPAVKVNVKGRPKGS